MRQRGTSYAEIADVVGVALSYACRVYKRGNAGDIKGTRSRRKGQQTTLGKEQKAAVQKTIQDRTPDQMKMPFALGTRHAVQELIKRQHGVKMPIRTVGEYLMRWGFALQKPICKAYEQRPECVQKWLQERYLEITKCAKEEGSEISWCDETGLHNDENRAKGYAPKGKTPTIRLNANRTSMSMVSAITNQGKVRFMIYREAMNADLMIQFMERLIRDTGRKVFLIVDNLKTHHSKVVKKWLQQDTEQIEVFYLPSCSPELNPDGYLNSDLKYTVHSGLPACNNKELKRKKVSHMRKLQKLSGQVRKYFEHSRIMYGA